MSKKHRIVSLDFVRAFACICIMITHFSAVVAGWTNGSYAYPNLIIPSYYFGNKVYIGGIGVSIFFMLTGASLMLSYKEGNLPLYYKKRFLSIYPMFWIVFVIASVVDFLYFKTLGSPDLRLLPFSIVGMDGYLGAMGLIPFGFYKVGEWFLGCIICLYILFPLLHYCFARKPILTMLGVMAIYIAAMYGIYGLGMKSNGTEFYLKFPELLLGMCLVRYNLVSKPNKVLLTAAVAAVLAVATKNFVSSPTLTTLVSIGIGGVVFWIAEKIRCNFIQKLMTKIAALSYPVYLIHHWLINRMVTGFNLMGLPRRDLYMLFGTYVIVCFLLAIWVTNLTKNILQFFKKADQ